jgi:hypothetical protein
MIEDVDAGVTSISFLLCTRDFVAARTTTGVSVCVGMDIELSTDVGMVLGIVATVLSWSGVQLTNRANRHDT